MSHIDLFETDMKSVYRRKDKIPEQKEDWKDNSCQLLKNFKEIPFVVNQNQFGHATRILHRSIYI